MKFEIPEIYKQSSGIYSVTNIVTGKRIIGQTVNFWNRFWVYGNKLKKGICGNKHLQNSYDKYGGDNFKMELLNLCSRENLTEMERYFCNAFGTLDSMYGYNKKDPIIHGKYSDDSRKRMSLSQLGNANALGHKLSDEMKNKISKIHIGNKYSVGQKRSEEAKKKMSESHLGKRLSEEHKKKIGAATKGHRLSEESKRKIGMASIGRRSFLGKKHSLETRQKISEARKGIKFTEEHKRNMSAARKEEWRIRKLKILSV